MENMQQRDSMGMKNTCTCKHHHVIPVLIVLFGLTFLLGNMGILTWAAVGMVWPILVIAGGIMKIMNRSGMCKCC